MDPDLGYLYFAKHFAYIPTSLKENCYLTAPIPMRTITQLSNADLILTCYPQTGKTTVQQFILWYARLIPDATILIAVP